MQKTNQSPETTRESAIARYSGGIRAREHRLGEPKWGEYRKGCALLHCIGALRRAGMLERFLPLPLQRTATEAAVDELV